MPIRNAVADAYFKVVPPKPRHVPPRPCFCQMVRTAVKSDLKRLSCLIVYKGGLDVLRWRDGGDACDNARDHTSEHVAQRR